MLLSRFLSNKIAGQVVSLTLLTLAACGSGESTSGGLNDPSAAKYIGVQSIDLVSSPFSVQTNASVQIAFNSLDQTVTIEGTDFTASGSATNGSYSISSPQISFKPGSGSTCTGAVTYSGLINAVSSAGDLTGSLLCDGRTFDVSGSYSAEPTYSKIIPIFNSFSDAVGAAL